MAESPFLASAKRTIEIEKKSVADLVDAIDQSFEQACTLLMSCKGRVVVTGMGKSGHIGRKIAATFSSTGTPAMFVHPGEASHGDMGMITAQDVVIAMSNSGTTPEILTILPLIKRLGAPLIAFCGNANSALADNADVNLLIKVSEEACPLGLAPTSSTTAALVMGDALAIALLEAKGFSAEDFAFSHPGGALGRQLLTRVSDVMETGASIPKVDAATSIARALLEMSAKGLGMTTVVENDTLLGIFTDGDLRRTLDHGINIQDSTIAEVMTKDCKTITADMLAAEALRIMETSKISGLAVLDREGKLEGVLHLHNLLRAGIA